MKEIPCEYVSYYVFDRGYSFNVALTSMKDFMVLPSLKRK